MGLGISVLLGSKVVKMPLHTCILFMGALRLRQLVVLLVVLGFNFVYLQLLCQIWGVWDFYVLSIMCYSYADWSLKLSIGLRALGLLVGLWHDFCILSRLVWLKESKK